VLALATAVLVVAAVRPGGPSGIEQGLEASSARWSALGAYHAAEAASKQSFLRTVWAFEEAFQRGDVDQIIGFYAPHAVDYPPGFPPSEGREAIEADLRWFFGEFDLDREFDLVDYRVAGNYGTRLGEWTQTLTPTAGGDPIDETGRCMVGFERKRGQWKVVWEIWNYYELPSE
jgi:ketosteroid isomerase-like protein